MTEIIGMCAMIITIIYSCFGLPVQYIKNYKRKSTDGVSLVFVLSCTLTMLMWCLYAWTKTPKDWFILGSNIPGFVFASALLTQFWIYRKQQTD
ncbi:MAG: hypothetical protein A2268_16990 [Candidatus Raymondbacteria bacterium RifOxyA12_full_50_37]|uniref:MtN3 and saliva related transmembrane protein n=1 Tax=Candidatus Raymondbacteria bacterium RIFOXYD12_FULL_49_13 TaxID=1817890 RepID=A0A1F7FCP5_UNCRA|nr:MAG: hypothetical protein A2268_16990 [Candidatus Raymondbacteria bacterium RifOxyA12_full_50_37]OGJ86305.1 MAG: hypothetical protein A2248_16590 [Candidatus Raymondbacteria bacterium RIFOXYA2_FULL_49_16]OGJ89988.1 MAG: hypothetical protein A2350_08045 [Candidatus Raymondbacteria bacterium RifOxyB12_full_50_8]OGJ95843.1 MAG: hypothetical protein A2453_11900 [Candidatus Raymondbacteria bacterium RIFOXYC2_FULL_50_21]OGJ96519.1 MAG: hypothetical protein A2487_19925 [Candidatus Raymondbacteria b